MKRLYIGKIAYTVDNTQLKELFEKFGELLTANVVTDDEGRSKGFGFVEFSNAKDADKAVEKMHGKDHLGFELEVSVAKNQN